MKKYGLVAIPILIGSLLLADEIDDMVYKITTPRVNVIPKDKILSTPSPMPKVVVADTNTTKDENGTLIVKKTEEYNLTGIINNRANINGKWIKVGEKIGRFKLVDIMDDSVYLKDGNDSKMVFFGGKKSEKIKIILGR